MRDFQFPREFLRENLLEILANGFWNIDFSPANIGSAGGTVRFPARKSIPILDENPTRVARTNMSPLENITIFQHDCFV
ncbi:hypothetical protein WN51_14520 [Melipona quadrifasciata]|uniref:Uncharacterized protein n=1 Tax=Melipona quadrifasciata TaxID=166423 RepID=A0A0N1ITH7_9HYME|nr:hypothetical protein WN51_14520 [Melipona quadrifasciata]